MQWPDQFQANQRADGLMELTDIAPPARRRRIKIPTAMQGKTLLPILRGTADPHAHRGYVFSEYYNA